jgi:hypothetical protein
MERRPKGGGNGGNPDKNIRQTLLGDYQDEEAKS